MKHLKLFISLIFLFDLSANNFSKIRRYLVGKYIQQVRDCLVLKKNLGRARQQLNRFKASESYCRHIEERYKSEINIYAEKVELQGMQLEDIKSELDKLKDLK